MQLYHFTSRHHVRGCIREGLRLGMIPQSIAPPRVLDGYQWLTTNPARRQSWNEGSSLPYNRTAYRLTIRIPDSQHENLLRWSRWGQLLAPAEMVRTLGEFGDPENWWLFAGAVEPEWIRDVERTSKAVPKVSLIQHMEMK